MRFMKKIPVAFPDIGPKEKKYVLDALNLGWVSGIGPMVSKFEQAFASYVGTKHGLAVSSGAAALDVALLALGIGPGDEVLVPTFTFAATVNSIMHQGATPVFIDARQDDWNIDVAQIELHITKKTKAIIVVHIYGIPAAMSAILKLANKYHLYVVEDAAEAHGAKIGNRMVGSMGDIGCFSFFANKIITTGEGGICVTNNKKLDEKMRLLYTHGSNKSHGTIYYYHSAVGYNFRLSNIQAALGYAQLSRIKTFLAKRNQHEMWYRSLLSGVQGISFSPQPKGTTVVPWMHSIFIRHSSVSRDDIFGALKVAGIESRPFFYPLHLMPPYRAFAREEYPVSLLLSNGGLNLPSAVGLTKKDIERITSVIKHTLHGN